MSRPWPKIPLGDIAKISSGGTPSRKSADYWTGPIPWVTTSLIDFRDIHAAEETITSAGLKHSSAKLLQSGTLLLALYGQGATRGKIARLAVDAATNQACAAIVPTSQVDRDFLYHYLAFSYTELRKLSNSGSQENLSGELLKQFLIPLPPIAVQQRLVKKIESWDRAISLTERLISTKLKQRKGLMQQLLSGKRRFPGFSEPWHEITLRQITTESKQRNNDSYGRDTVRAVTNSVGMIPMRAQTIAENLNRYKVVEPRRFAYNPMRINVGSICMWDGAEPTLVSPDYVVFNCNDGALDPDFFNYLRQTHRWDYYMNVAGNGSVRVRIYYGDLAALHFKIPPYREQRKISSVLRTADREIALLRDQLAALKEQKKGLMQQLLTGKKRVPLSSNVDRRTDVSVDAETSGPTGGRRS